jgi:hypothetical protein
LVCQVLRLWLQTICNLANLLIGKAVNLVTGAMKISCRAEQATLLAREWAVNLATGAMKIS